MNMLKALAIVSIIAIHFGCKKEQTASLHFKIKFDPIQERLSSTGTAQGIGSGNAAQSPVMNSVGIQKFILLNNASTPSTRGQILINTPEINTSGSTAVDISQLKMVKEGEILLSIPFDKIKPGQYEWIRTDVAYQNMDVMVNMLNVPFVGNLYNERGTLAGFLGNPNYITKYKIWEKEDVVNGTKKQGYWGLETKFNAAYASLNKIYTDQITEGSITFVNPISQTSPIPSGACSVTGRFDTPLSITGQETEDLTVTITFSVNNSFEWEESINRNGKWDINAQANTGQPTIEKIIDIGLRSLKASYSKSN